MKLTPTMLHGLRHMATRLKSQRSTLAEPNENTGKALVARGLIELVDKSNGWNRYVLTAAGRELLAKEDGETG